MESRHRTISSLPIISDGGRGEKDDLKIYRQPRGAGRRRTILLSHLQKLPNGGQTEGHGRRSDGGEERLAGCKTDGPSPN